MLCAVFSVMCFMLFSFSLPLCAMQEEDPAPATDAELLDELDVSFQQLNLGPAQDNPVRILYLGPFPTPLVKIILGYVLASGPRSVGRLARVCRSWNRLLQSMPGYHLLHCFKAQNLKERLRFLIEADDHARVNAVLQALCAKYGVLPAHVLYLRDATGGSLLHSAMVVGKTDIVRDLFLFFWQHGVDVNGYLGTELYDAIAANDVDQVRQLLDAGADPDGMVNCHGQTCVSLWNTDLGGNIQAVGRDVVQPDHNVQPIKVFYELSHLWTAIVVPSKNPDIIALLIQHGANVHAEGPDGGSMLSYALKNSLDDIATLLRAAGVKETKTISLLEALGDDE